MKRKIISIVLIFMLTLMITVDLYKQQAVAVAPAVVLIPAATYAIYVSLAAAGVIGNTDNDHRYLANDYISKISDYEKAQWNAIAKYGMVAGSMVLSGALLNSIKDYVTNNHKTGENIISGTESISGPYQTTFDNKSVTRNDEKYTVEMYQTYASLYINNKYTTVLYLGRRYQIGMPYHLYFNSNAEGTWLQVDYYSSEPHNIEYLRYGINTGTAGIKISNTNWTPTSSEYVPNYKWFGDVQGLGVALSAAGSMAINLPSSSSLGKTLDQVEADQAIADWLEAEMNKVNKTNKPNWGGPGGSAAVIAALAATSYYWLDPVTKKITQTTTQTPPPGEDLIPLPAPGTQTIPVAPSLPDNYPTEDNPEIKTKLSDPIITTIDNGNGTHTETKTQEETKTERYYDPEKQRWIEKTTKTKTTTTTDIDDQTGDRTETGRTTETLPDGNTTENPPPKDATDIDWGPLKQGIGSLTNKFPFCLPWDIYNSFVQFQGVEWSGIINIDISKVSSKFPVGWDFDIDFSMFDELRQIVKKIELMLFDLGLILATRKLMGGGV